MEVRVTKLRIYSQQNKNMQIYKCQRSKSSFVQGHCVYNNFKHLLLRNFLANRGQIPRGTSMELGNEILFKWSRSHDQDGRHAVYDKNI